MLGTQVKPTGVLAQVAPGLQSVSRRQPPQRPPRQRPKGQMKSASELHGRPAAAGGPSGVVGLGAGAGAGSEGGAVGPGAGP